MRWPTYCLSSDRVDKAVPYRPFGSGRHKHGEQGTKVMVTLSLLSVGDEATRLVNQPGLISAVCVNA